MNPSARPPAPGTSPMRPGSRPLRRSLAALLWLAAASAGAQTAPGSPPARLLASNCFQCHGTNGKGPGFDRLAGKPAQEIYEEMKAFQSGKEGNGIMAKHSLGYTDAQLRLLSQWLSTQR